MRYNTGVEEIKDRQDNRFFACIARDELSGAYLLHGDEPYTRERAIRQITGRLNPDLADMNLIRLSAPAGADVINACETLPFFDARRVVIVSELTGDGAEPLKPYVDRVPDTALLLIVHRGKANAQTPLYPAMQKLGRTVEFAPYPPERAASFVMKRADENGIPLERAVAARLVDMLGCDLAQLESALLKAGAYAGEGGPVTRSTLDACITPNLEYKVFAMLDAFVAGNRAHGLRMLQTQLQNGDPALGIASFFLGRAKQMLLAKQLLEQGKSEAAVAKALGGNPYAAKMTVKNARRMAKAQLQTAVVSFANVDSLLKQGVMRDADALLLAIYRSFPAKT